MNVSVWKFPLWKALVIWKIWMRKEDNCSGNY